MVRTRGQTSSVNKAPRSYGRGTRPTRTLPAEPASSDYVARDRQMEIMAQQIQSLTAAVEALRRSNAFCQPLEGPGAPALQAVTPQSHRSPLQEPRSGGSPPPSFRCSRDRRTPSRHSPDRHCLSRGQQALSRSFQDVRPGEPSRRKDQRHGKRPRSPSSSPREGSTPTSFQRGEDARRLDEYDRKFREIDQRFAQLPSGQPAPAVVPCYRALPPLSRRILDEPIPDHFKVPRMEPYSGATDPTDHLSAFKTRMMVQKASNALYCIAFPATLSGAAQTWYASLESGSIHSFE